MVVNRAIPTHLLVVFAGIATALPLQLVQRQIMCVYPFFLSANVSLKQCKTVVIPVSI